jgi:hypothetical protein
MLHSLRHYGCGVFFFLVFCSLLYLIGVVPHQILYVLIAIGTGFLYALICWRCRIRSKMNAIYGEDAEAYIVPHHGKLTAWTPTMVLPPIPTSRCDPRQIHGETPDNCPPP